MRLSHSAAVFAQLETVDTAWPSEGVSESDRQNESPKALRDDDWVYSSTAIAQVRTATLSPMANVAMAKRAHAGLLRAHTELMIINGTQRHHDCEVPAGFWWAEGGDALKQNWELGDFETWFDHRVRYQIFGVKFHRDDIDQIVRMANPRQSPPQAQTATESSGRKMSELWPDWVAELSHYIHEEGYPAGQGSAGAEMLIAAIETRLAERGLTAPGRATVQVTVKAVLQRHRSAGN